jgi:hypothetical protein
VLDEIEQQRLGPVQVVDHEHDGLRAASAARKRAHDEEVSSGGAGAPESSAATPLAIRLPSASSPTTARAPRAPLQGSRRPRPAGTRAARRAIGANVAPPAASQCADSTVRLLTEPARDLAITRDLPSPGEPSTKASRAR